MKTATNSTNTPNASAKMATEFTDVMKRYQDLGRDIEALREHLRSPARATGGAARIAACQLSALTLGQALTICLITALSEEEKSNAKS